jgi:hypothetical protein
MRRLMPLQHGREIAQPYGSWGLKIFATFYSASKIFSAGAKRKKWNACRQSG